ncbi:MAG: DUF1566 domain-containing protein [Spirochaetes bacterium]|nr:DUF1566 domain-containing protein [Spirochaetota bacterium]
MKKFLLLYIVLAAALLSCYDTLNDVRGEINSIWLMFLADTGQNQCYDTAGAVIACSDFGDYPRQDGQWTDKPRGRSYTGPTEYAGDYTTRDNVAGLVWISCARGQTGSDCSAGAASTATWTDANNYCASLDYAGRTNWRLPTNQELQATADYRYADPTIDSEMFPNTPTTYGFHSSTPYYAGAPFYWMFSYDIGRLSNTSTSQYTRCVSDGP